MKNAKTYIGIFLISLATLALEISLIRFLSISQWYYFAFMVVSIALFGIAAAGTFLAIFRRGGKHHTPTRSARLRAGPSQACPELAKREVNSNLLFLSSIFFSLSVIIGFFVVNNIIFDPYRAILDFKHVFVLLIYYLFLGLPFFFFGIIIAYCFANFQDQAGKIYFYNMTGSALGTLAALFFISYLQVRTIFVISLLGLVSALFFIPTDKNKKKLDSSNISREGERQEWRNKASPKTILIKVKLHFATPLIYLLIAINLLLFFFPPKLNISPYKELNQALNVPGSELIDTKYNSFSRVDVVKSSFTRYAPGLSPTFDKTLPEQIGITVDAGNMNSITKDEDLDFIDHLPAAIPYYLSKNKKTLIINSGAGLDVLAALKNDAEVTALETNPIVIDLLQNNYADFSGNIYNQAEVVWGEGRSFVKNNKNIAKFDIIIISLAGNVLSGSGEIFGLSENYLLTKEAFQDYHRALTEDGVLVITRWLMFPPRESLRLFSLALEIDQEAKRTALFRSWTTVTLLMSKSDLDQNRIEKIKNFSDQNKFDLIYLPTDFIPNKNLKFKEPYYYNAVQNLLREKNKFYQDYIFDVNPVTDNKPFYFNFFKISKIRELSELMNQKWNPFLDSGFLVFIVLLQTFALTLIFILLPIWFFNRNNRDKQVNKQPLIYFFAIGLSYLFIEIVLLQKFILFLGHVTFSFAVVVFAMLLFSGLGALYSQKLRIQKINKIIFAIFILIISYIFLLSHFINLFISFGLVVKIILSIVVIAPLGFLMGFPFPMGIRTIKKELINWAWAVNGSASVLSPLLAIFIALFFGYNVVLFLAGLIYLAGIIFIQSKNDFIEISE